MFKGVPRSVLMCGVILGLIGVWGGVAPASAQDGAAGCTPAKGAKPAGRSVQTIKSGGQSNLRFALRPVTIGTPHATGHEPAWPRL
jgi:hypothetical protein